MTKNTKTILLSLLACLLLITGFELGEGRIRFGSATLNDSSTVGLITMNKGLRVNGLISSTDTIRTSGILRTTELQLTGASPQIYWTTYGMYIDGSIDALTYNANAHAIATESGTSLIYTDSTNGTGLHQIPGRGLVYNKLVKFATTSASLPAYVNFPHGLTGAKIIQAVCNVRADTTGWNLNGTPNGDITFPPRCPLASAGTFDFLYDETNLSVYLASTATAIRNNTDTAFVWITYISE